ncbi:MAG: FecR domain-containing protein [Planctomycetes bacterium]|nr:FecR domain-containing protein [Planctomycetota bacterium]
MSCERFSERFILDSLRDETQGPGAEELRTHIKTCPDCRARVDEMKSLLTGIDQLAEATHIEPAPEIKNRVMAEARKVLAQRQTSDQGRPGVIMVFRHTLQYAAAAAVILAVWWVVDAMRGSRPTENVVAATISDIEGPLRIERAPQNQGAETNSLHTGDTLLVGERPATFTYNNGYRIRLEANSALSVYGGRNVLRLERGGMRADGCECGKEMRVVTSSGTVRCTGGEFSLKVEPDGQARFVVHRGSAGVCCNGCGKTWRKLQAGETMTWSQTGWRCGEEGRTNDRGCGCGR